MEGYENDRGYHILNGTEIVREPLANDSRVMMIVEMAMHVAVLVQLKLKHLILSRSFVYAEISIIWIEPISS